MAKSQPEISLKFVFAAALSLLAACGRDPNVDHSRIARDLSNPKKTSAAAKQLTQVSDQSASLVQAGQQVTSAALLPGTYELKTLTSEFEHIDNKSSTEHLHVIHSAGVLVQGATVTFSQNPQDTFGGSLSKDPQSSRVVQLPQGFSVPSQPWVPKAADISKTLMVNDQLVVAKQNYSLKDTVVDADPNNIKISIVDILTANNIDSSQDYTLKADKDVPVALKIYKLNDGKTWRFMISIAEISASQTNTTTSVGTVTETRNLYVDYSFTPQPSPNPPQPSPDTPSNPMGPEAGGG